MTTATEDTTTTTASPTSEVELVMDGLDLETVDNPPVVTEPAPPAAAPATTPPVTQPPAPPAATTPEPKKGNLGTAVQEERTKRRRANERADFWQGKAQEIKRAAERTVENLTLRGRTRPKDIMSDKEIADIAAAAEKAESVGVAIDAVLREMRARVNKAFVEHEESLEQVFFKREIDRSEAKARKTWKDYDDALIRAGIRAGVVIDPSTQTWANPEIGKAVFVDGKDDPGEAAYLLAKAMLGEPVDGNDARETTAPVTGDDGTEPPAPRAAAPVPPTAPAPPARGTQPTAPVPAAAPTTPPRGLRVLRDAGGGPPRVELNADLARTLDSMMEQTPEKFRAFMEKNPEIDKWYMSL